MIFLEIIVILMALIIADAEIDDCFVVAYDHCAFFDILMRFYYRYKKSNFLILRLLNNRL